MTDEEALNLIKEGDAQAGLVALRERYHARLVGYAYGQIDKYIYRGPKSADEIVNDVWSSFWEKFEGRTIKSLPAYLRSMVRYQVLQALTEDIRLRERQGKEAPDMPDETERTKVPSVEVERLEELIGPLVMKNELLIAVSTLELLGRLTERKAQAVVLRYIHGFSADEVAKRMETNTNNAASLISQGAKVVREYLERRGRVTD